MDDPRRARFIPLLLHRGSHTHPAPSPPRPTSLRSRPLLFISTFLILHQSLTTLALIPAYTYFRYTDASLAFLGGPYAAFVLRQHVPFSKGELKVEDLVEAGVRRGIKTGWRLVSKWRGRKLDESEEKEVAREVVEGLEGKSRLRDRVTDRARGLREGVGKWKETRMERASMEAKTAAESTRGVTMRHVMDAAAAYLVVKAIFPVRLAASLLITPRLARAFGRRWG